MNSFIFIIALMIIFTNLNFREVIFLAIFYSSYLFLSSIKSDDIEPRPIENKSKPRINRRSITPTQISSSSSSLDDLE